MVIKKQNTLGTIRYDIIKAGEGKVYVLSDFTEYGDYETVKKALQYLYNEGIINRLLPGVYYRPIYSAILRKDVPPKTEDIAAAIARNNNWIIIPEGEKGLNMLGLSTQVPAHIVFITNGPSKKYEIGKQSFEFKHVQPKDIVGLSEKTALVVEAMKNLGEKNINEVVIARLKEIYTCDEKKQLLSETRKITRWIRNIMVLVIQDKESINV